MYSHLSRYSVFPRLIVRLYIWTFLQEIAKIKPQYAPNYYFCHPGLELHLVRILPIFGIFFKH
jgi:hypothetical protein